MINLKKVLIKDNNSNELPDVHIININEKKILFSGKLKGRDGVKGPVDYWEEGLLYALGKTGVNFLWEDRLFLTTEEFNELLK